MSINKPFDQRQPDDLVHIDGPDAFADMDKAQREFDYWYENVWMKLTPEQREQAAEEARAALDREAPKLDRAA